MQTPTNHSTNGTVEKHQRSMSINVEQYAYGVLWSMYCMSRPGAFVVTYTLAPKRNTTHECHGAGQALRSRFTRGIVVPRGCEVVGCALTA